MKLQQFDRFFKVLIQNITPFSTDVPLLYTLTTTENWKFCVFRGYRNGTLVKNISTKVVKHSQHFDKNAQYCSEMTGSMKMQEKSFCFEQTRNK